MSPQAPCHRNPTNPCTPDGGFLGTVPAGWAFTVAGSGSSPQSDTIATPRNRAGQGDTGSSQSGGLNLAVSVHTTNPFMSVIPSPLKPSLGIATELLG